MPKTIKTKRGTPSKKVASKKAFKKVSAKKVTKKASPNKTAIKNAKKIAKKVAVKKGAKKAEVKKVAKKTALKKKVKGNSDSIRKIGKSNSTIVVFNIRATAYKSEDYSGATITEWFDTGNEADQIACPDDYKKQKNGYLVLWERRLEDGINFDLLNDALGQMRFWANEYDASFNTGSYISIESGDGVVLKKYSFDSDSWV